MLIILKRKLCTSVAAIQGTVERSYGYGFFYYKAWMTKQKILERLFGTYEKSFQNLPRTLLAIRDSNPGIIITWDHKMVDDNKAIFERAFWIWFLDLLRWCVMGEHTELCILLDKHVAIKSFMAWIFPEPIGYHWSYSRHFVSNFNTKFKNVVLKTMLHRMCTNPSK